VKLLGRVCILVCVFVLFLSAANAQDIEISLNGEILTPTVAPIIQAGRTLVPLRFIGEALDLMVEYDSPTKTVILTGDDMVIELPIGLNMVRANGIMREIDVPAQLMQGTTMVPLSFISNLLGAQVTFNPVTKAINIMITHEPVANDGYYHMTGDALVYLPEMDVPIPVAVMGWFELEVTDEMFMKSGMETSIEMPYMTEPVGISLIYDPDGYQYGELDADGNFWMLTSMRYYVEEMEEGEGYPVMALEKGTFDVTTNHYQSNVALSIMTGPFQGSTVLFSKGGSRSDSLEDIRALLRKESLTEAERERIRDYLRESSASEAEKIRILRDLIGLAQDATGETLVITPLEILDEIIEGIRNIEESFYQRYKQMRDSGMIDGPAGFPNGTLSQRQKYEMRYLLEELRKKLE